MKVMFTRGLLLVMAAFICTAVLAVELESDTQKLSYTIGLDIGKSLNQQGEPIDLETLFDAINTGYSGAEAAMTQEEVTAFRAAFMKKRQTAMEQERLVEGEKNRADNEKFLLANRTKDGVKETSSGLQYQVLSQGEGAKPKAEDTVTVHYKGTLVNGDTFDSSYERNQPATFALNGVIPGWTEGLQLMSPGSKFKFFVPPELAYGPDGRAPVIPPSALLIFEVELLEIGSSN